MLSLKTTYKSFAVLIIVTLVGFFASASGKIMPTKEWTFLLFLNGHNNLDSFGHMNIKLMEQVGSSDQVNYVVQWASEENGDTQRLYIEKSTNSAKVTSPVIEKLPAVDMGDYRELVEFIDWGVKKYPAKKYFIAVWNHGSGWHRSNKPNFSTQDISYDDLSGNKITTEQLGLAMAEASKIIGHKVDIYGSDACLMSMAEVASEMSDSVQVSVGSEEVEPGEGWPYSTFMKRWNDNPTASSADVGRFLTEEYVKAYTKGGIYPARDVTFSALDLEKITDLHQAFYDLSKQLISLDNNRLKKVKLAADATLGFAYADSKDALDFLLKIESNQIFASNEPTILKAKTAIKSMVIASKSTKKYQNANGLAIWIPGKYDYSQELKTRYKDLVFNKHTNWGSFVDLLQTQY